MIERGDVVVARRRVGFGASGEDERFIVVQEDGLAQTLASVVVVPLDAWSASDASDPLSVRVGKREAGAKSDLAARVPLIGARPVDRFSPHPVGRVTGTTLSALEDRIRVLLALT